MRLAADGYFGDRLKPLTAEERVIHYDGARSVEANGYRRMLDMYGEFLSEPGKTDGLPCLPVLLQDAGRGGVSSNRSPEAFGVPVMGGGCGRWPGRETGMVGVILDTAGFAPRFDLSVEKVPNGIEVMAVTQIERGLKGITLLMDTRKRRTTCRTRNGVSFVQPESAVVRAGGQIVTENYSGHLEYRQNVRTGALH